MKRGPKPIPIEVRFWNKVVKTKGCWKWSGCVDGFGYGNIQSPGGTRTAHRVSWEIHNGPIPKGKCVLHRCDNPPCSNPKHLFTGAKRDNVVDAYRKGRMHPPSLRGERCPASKLTEIEVMEIRKRYIPGVISLKSLGDIYGVWKGTIHQVVKEKTWRSIQKAQ